jgi:hypothetical protein
MASLDDVQAVYKFLTTQILPMANKATVTYGRIERDTGVPIGEYGGYIGEVLGEIADRCADRGLPPLTSIVVNAADGIPGSGFFVEMAEVQQRGNPAGWRIDPGVERWIQRPAPPGFDKASERWNYRAMITEQQESVWGHATWPPSL